jgi:hypothetical protein
MTVAIVTLHKCLYLDEEPRPIDVVVGSGAFNQFEPIEQIDSLVGKPGWGHTRLWDGKTQLNVAEPIEEVRRLVGEALARAGARERQLASQS